MTSPTETEHDGTVTTAVHHGVATVTFYHPKRNALPAIILRQLADAIDGAGSNPDARVVILASEGTGAFCAGASFDELRGLKTSEIGRASCRERGAMDGMRCRMS